MELTQILTKLLTPIEQTGKEPNLSYLLISLSAPLPQMSPSQQSIHSLSSFVTICHREGAIINYTPNHLT